MRGTRDEKNSKEKSKNSRLIILFYFLVEFAILLLYGVVELRWAGNILQGNHVHQHQASINLMGMEAELYEAASSGSFEEVSRISNWREQETATGNNILHVHVGKPLHNKEEYKRKGLVLTEFIEKLLKDEEGSIAGYKLMWKLNINGDTPLHLAARFGHDKAVQAFLERAKEVNQEEVSSMLNKKKDTALHEAARAGHAAAVELLLKANSNCPHEPNEDGETPLYLAAERGCTSSVIIILDICNPSALSYQQKGPCGRTALHAAVQWGKPEMVMRILEKDRSLIRIQTDEGLTPLHCAAAEIHKLELMEILLQYDNIDKGSSAVYIRDNMGRTALDIAMLRWNWNVIKKLIASCPDSIEMVDNSGQNVVHYVAKWTCLAKMVRVLSIGNLDKLINDKDVDGNTPLHLLAAYNLHVPHKGLHFCLSHLPRFIKDYPHVDLKAYNKQNLTVGDIMVTYDNLLRQERILVGRRCKATPRGRRMNTYESDIDVEKETYCNSIFHCWFYLTWWFRSKCR
ncbi:ankyrin repeat-containing protein At5g02620 [Spinacia oleracea]|uniref:Ankyrin repeat-containing protein At5g02620 n=1 Tax=Spinacia oleracea TaxID=3562 RepID=A0ABM3QLN2_SPIOL|nr:ankyrin repeat-containing protein At5g02620-like [Spinacia oleracea]